MEEEIEAMVTDHQFLSSDGVDDIFSKLPEDIMHCILSCLPCNKEMVRTSGISKSWLQAWRAFPVFEFNLQDFIPPLSSLSDDRDKVEAKRKQFIRFVDNRLQRFQRKNGDGLITFNLLTVNKMAYHAYRWISMALDYKLEHLSICIFYSDGSMHPCLIPDRVLSAYWLKTLSLKEPLICIPLTENSRVDLPSLTSLSIEKSDISDEQLQILLRGCPVLEDIALLRCDFLSKVDIFYHPNLKTLKVSIRSINSDLTAIRVRAPKLKSFAYNCIGLDRNVVVKIYNSPELKSLSIGEWIKTDEWFHNFIAQFPLIENLIIDTCIGLRKIRISNPLLEKISINTCYNLEDVVISCKKLESLILVSMLSSIPKLSIRMDMDNPPNDCKAQIKAPRWSALRMINTSWFGNLKEFLKRSITFESVAIIVQELSDVGLYMIEKDVQKKLPHQACNIGKLKLVVTGTAPTSCYSQILNGSLSACHPTTLKLDVTSVNHFVKLVCEELGSVKKRKRQCYYCKDEFKCWKHQLKEVKIEKIKGIKLEENLDWDVLSNMLPTLEHGNHIYFKLMW